MSSAEAWLTAYGAIFWSARMQPGMATPGARLTQTHRNSKCHCVAGETILIHAGASGVGTAAILVWLSFWAFRALYDAARRLLVYRVVPLA
jgi:NADPH:quinone reductase-like Zn-dependent oxidoreductase